MRKIIQVLGFVIGLTPFINAQSSFGQAVVPQLKADVDGVFIKSGEIFHFEGLGLMPTADFTLSNATLSKFEDYTISPAPVNKYLKRYFTLSSTVTGYTGKFHFSYSGLTDLKGSDNVALTESSLTLNLYNGSSWKQVASTVDATNDTVTTSSAVSNQSLSIFMLASLVTAPSTQASSVSFSSTTNSQTTIGWTNGNGTNRIVFVKAASSGSPTPVDGTSYTANTIFTSGDQIASTGWYCVYNGTGSSVSVTGLSAATTYRVMVLEYDAAAGGIYNTSTATNNPNNVTTAGVPTISSISSNPICAGSTLTITGTYFTNASAVTLNGVAASSYSVVDATTITASFAAGSGTLSITTPGGTASYGSSVTVNAASVGGSISGSATVCTGTNSTLLTLSGYTGSITKWQSATASDFSGTVTDIANTATTYTATNLTTTTYYRAIVTSGACSAATSATATVTVDAASAGGTIANASVCTGTNSTTLTVSGYTGSITKWQSSSASDFSSSVSDISNTLATYSPSNLTSTTYYRAVVTNGVCTAANSGISTVTVSPVTVAGTIAITAGGSGTKCASSNSTTIGLTGNTGAVDYWESAADVNFTTSVVSNGNVGSTSITITNLPSTRYYRAVVKSGACASANSNGILITIDAAPEGGIATAAPPATLNVSGSTTITLSSYSGSIQWQSSANNSTWSDVTGGSGATTYQYTTPTFSSTTYYRAVLSNGVCNVANGTAKNSTTATVTITNNHTWTGNSGSDWNTGNNWNPASVPVVGANLTIPDVSGQSNNPPVLYQTPNAMSNLTVASGATITLGVYSLSVTGNLTHNGTITGNGLVAMSGSSAQTISGTGTVSNLTINNASGVTISSGSNSLTITGTLTPTAGTLTTNDNLVLKSDAYGTARITAGTGTYISGKVTVERYIHGANNGKRAWRFLSLPVSVSNLRNAWAGGKNANPSAPLGETAGDGTLITGHAYATGAAASAAGFDWFRGLGTNTYSSIRFYDGVNDNWESSTNTPSMTTAPDKPAYMLYIRGDRTVGSVTGFGQTTLRPKGNLKLGTQSYAISNTFEPIGNPYASPINLYSVFSDNSSVIDANFWVWDATQGQSGAFVALTHNGSYIETSTNVNAGLYTNIESGQAFFVQKKAAGTMTISESHKTGDNVKGVFGIASPITGKIGTLKIGLSQSGLSMDGAAVQFNDNYQLAPTESYDVPKMNNFNENLSLVNNDNYLSIESRPFPVVKDSVQLSFWSLAKSTYTLSLNGKNLGERIGSAVLVDRYTKTQTPLDLSGATTSYDFAVTADAASSSLTRFAVVFSAQSSLPTASLSIVATAKGTGISVNWQSNQESNLSHYELEHSTDGIVFTKLSSMPAFNQLNGASYAWLDVSPVPGSNSYRIKTVDLFGAFKYSPVAKVNWNRSAGIELLPTVTNDGRVTLVLRQQPTGTYRLNLFGVNGARLYSREIRHEQATAVYDLQLSAGAAQLVQGVYYLEVTNGVKRTKFKVVKH